MISKFNPCCKKCLNPNKNFYVRILNGCSYYIYFYLSYSINGKTVSKQSPVFAPNKNQFLTFPSGATEVFFITYNCEMVPPTALCNRIVPNNKSTCYNIIGHIACIEIPC